MGLMDYQTDGLAAPTPAQVVANPANNQPSQNVNQPARMSFKDGNALLGNMEQDAAFRRYQPDRELAGIQTDSLASSPSVVRDSTSRVVQSSTWRIDPSVNPILVCKADIRTKRVTVQLLTAGVILYIGFTGQMDSVSFAGVANVIDSQYQFTQFETQGDIYVLVPTTQTIITVTREST